MKIPSLLILLKMLEKWLCKNLSFTFTKCNANGKIQHRPKNAVIILQLKKGDRSQRSDKLLSHKTLNTLKTVFQETANRIAVVMT